MKIQNIFKRAVHLLFSTRAAGLYIITFAVSIAVATFIENDFGSSSAQNLVYRSWWFTLLLIFFSLSLIYNIYKFKMIRQKKWGILLFHLSMVIILIGAGITRYFGFEGMMHIREGSSSNTFLSAEPYLKFQVLDKGKMIDFEEQLEFSTLGFNSWEESYQINSSLLNCRVKRFIPNPVEKVVFDGDGKPTVKIVFGSFSGRQEYYLQQGETRDINNLVFSFEDNENADFKISLKEGTLFLESKKTVTQTVMKTQEKDTIDAGNISLLKLAALYSDGMNQFVFGDFYLEAITSLESSSLKVKNESIVALDIELKSNGVTKDFLVYSRKGAVGNQVVSDFGQIKVGVSYGAKTKKLPFSIFLEKFILDRYPGTDNPMSYASEVRLEDSEKGNSFDFRIFMNNILNYRGYRFFQSSFDQDEKGTYLSVNHDFWGTWVSYIGYILLTIGLISVFFDKKSRFSIVRKKLKKSGNTAIILLFLALGMVVSNNIHAQKIIDSSAPESIVSPIHAEIVSRALVQDHRGRIKPLHTMNRELLRKVSRKESFYGLNADQIVLGMFADPAEWRGVAIIKQGKHKDVNELLGSANKLLSYADFFDEKGNYKLSDAVEKAYSISPSSRGVFEKELMKIDERVNIVNMIFSGHLYKLVPIENDPNNTWASAQNGSERSQVASDFFDAYRSSLLQAQSSGDWTLPNKLVSELVEYQNNKGKEVVPGTTRIKAEILLNKSRIFNRLSIYYSIIGLLFLILLFITVFKSSWNTKKLFSILFWAFVTGFALHTIGLGLRWYVSGRAPWSNGYESMIYIAWTAVLAGFVFARKSAGGLAATNILSATILLVAHLSYLDPEITPLVPVLRSYWLTIHVSLEAGSYGFLMLGAIIGVINLILIVFINKNNKSHIMSKVKELSLMSELILIGGLVMISIGTYLGGVWANESWGRYWGWDAKETWALVTILVYAFILHMRIIPKLKGIFLYNFMTIIGWASVVMTYYGVNYYLSGLHSYAAGDPVPIPGWVYVVVFSVLFISSLSYTRYRMVCMKN